MNNQINIDDVISAIGCAKQSSAQTAEDCRNKAEKAAAEDERAFIHTAEMFEQQAARIGKLLDKIEAIHEAGYDYVGGVGERDLPLQYPSEGLVRP